jgi:hypothetical protein
MIRRFFMAIAMLACAVMPVLAMQPPAPIEGFVPIDSLPPAQQLPAAPFLVGAYVFFLLLMMFYLWTIWKRLGTVEREMKELERRSKGQLR